MLTRILTALIAFLVFLPFLIFSDTLAFPIAMAVCSVAGVFECLRCIGLHRNGWIAVPLYLSAAASPVALRLMPFDRFMEVALVVFLCLILYVLAVTVLSHGKVDVSLSSMALLISVYIMAGFSAMVFLRDFHEGGKYLFLLPFLGAWMTDIFAYFTGRLIGKHKLIPDVSPKKTVEGSIGGMIFCVVSFLLFAWLYNRFASVGGGHLSLPIMALAGLVTSVVSQIGDLAMSVIKRHFQVKDYGRIFPGHGGFLDRFDSVLAVSVVLASVLGLTLR